MFSKGLIYRESNRERIFECRKFETEGYKLMLETSQKSGQLTAT